MREIPVGHTASRPLLGSFLLIAGGLGLSVSDGGYEFVSFIVAALGLLQFRGGADLTGEVALLDQRLNKVAQQHSSDQDNLSSRVQFVEEEIASLRGELSRLRFSTNTSVPTQRPWAFVVALVALVILSNALTYVLGEWRGGEYRFVLHALSDVAGTGERAVQSTKAPQRLELDAPNEVLNREAVKPKADFSASEPRFELPAESTPLASFVSPVDSNLELESEIPYTRGDSGDRRWRTRNSIAYRLDKSNEVVAELPLTELDALQP